MVTTVSFPGLGLEFELNRVAFSIGGFNVYWYGLLIGIGFMLAGTYALLNARKVGVDSDRLIDVVMVGLVCGVIGARLYYVIFDWETFQGDLSKIFDIRQGGLAIYGGILAGMAGGIIMAKIRKVRVRPAMDLAAAGFLIGQGIGRWGNFVNVEAFGSNTSSILGMTGPKVVGYLTQVKNSGAAWAQNIDPHMPVHPTFLYESIWCFVGFLLLFRYIKKRRFNGDIALRYMIWYGAGRFWIEALRTDSLMLVPSIGLRASQLVAGIAVVAGVAAEIYFTHKFKDKPLMVELALNADNKAAMKKLDGPIAFAGSKTQLLASSPRKLFVERTEAYNAEVKRTIAESGKAEK